MNGRFEVHCKDLEFLGLLRIITLFKEFTVYNPDGGLVDHLNPLEPVSMHININISRETIYFFKTNIVVLEAIKGEAFQSSLIQGAR